MWTQITRLWQKLHFFFRFAVHSKLLYFSTEPLIPYNVTVVAVNLAGPGEQETANFFTRQGGVFLTNCVYGLNSLFLFLWTVSLVH